MFFRLQESIYLPFHYAAISKATVGLEPTIFVLLTNVFTYRNLLLDSF